MDNYVTNATSIRGGSSYYWKVGGTLLVISFLPVWRTIDEPRIVQSHIELQLLIYRLRLPIVWGDCNLVRSLVHVVNGSVQGSSIINAVSSATSGL